MVVSQYQNQNNNRKKDPAAKSINTQKKSEYSVVKDTIYSPESRAGRFLFGVCVLWSLFQVYIATPLPFITNFLLFDDTLYRFIHLSFAMFLGFCFYPFIPRLRNLLWLDWVLGIIAVYCCLHIVFFYDTIAHRGGAARTPVEIVVAVSGFILLLEITRRSIGYALVAVALAFTFFVFFGPWMPEFISHRGLSINRWTEHMWLSTEGIFGLPIGVSNSFVFLYVLFGTLLDRAGAGNYLIQLSLSLLGHRRGGPAKAAVVSSGLTGVISGSCIANIVTTGTFTIPLMKKMGFPAEKAAAVEVTSSMNGQIMPPVMGAAAFLMTEFIGISYFEVIKHSFLPAVIAYFGLYCIVHLEAIKMNLPTFKRAIEYSRTRTLINSVLGFLAIIIISGVIYGFFTAIKFFFPSATLWLVLCAVTAIYLILLVIAFRYSPAEKEDMEVLMGAKTENTVLPQTLPTLLSGLYFFVPIGILVWCLMIERWSPELSVTWAIVAVILQIITQDALRSQLTDKKISFDSILAGCQDLFIALGLAGKNMVSVVIAMAAAGIIVGSVSATGLALLMTEIIQLLSGGNVLIMLILTAVMCVVLGMGLPTTANYIVVASIMATALVSLAAQNGIIIPLVAVHLFVFYFGLISGATPPVAIDAYTGAAVAGAHPVKTCLLTFFYSLRTALLPFIFVFNPQLLFIGIHHWWDVPLIVISAGVAMLAFAGATQLHLKAPNRKWETAALLLVSFTLLNPAFWLDRLIPPYTSSDPLQIHEIVNAQPDNALIRLAAEGENFSGNAVSKIVLLSLGKRIHTDEDRLYKDTGLKVITQDKRVIVDDIRFGSSAQTSGIDYDWIITSIQVQSERPAKQWFYLPAYILLGIIFILQRQRIKRE